jgi:hypothetical protein
MKDIVDPLLKSRVMHSHKMSYYFQVNTKIKQGCLLWKQLDYLDFAEDIAQFGQIPVDEEIPTRPWCWLGHIYPM